MRDPTDREQQLHGQRQRDATAATTVSNTPPRLGTASRSRRHASFWEFPIEISYGDFPETHDPEGSVRKGGSRVRITARTSAYFGHDRPWRRLEAARDFLDRTCAFNLWHRARSSQTFGEDRILLRRRENGSNWRLMRRRENSHL